MKDIIVLDDHRDTDDTIENPMDRDCEMKRPMFRYIVLFRMDADSMSFGWETMGGSRETLEAAQELVADLSHGLDPAHYGWQIVDLQDGCVVRCG